MHFIFAWDCEGASPERLAELEQLFEANLAKVRCVKIFPRLYAVHVMGNGVYEVLQLNLMAFAKAQPETVKFVMGPLMSSGTFHGRLGHEAVQGLNAIVQPNSTPEA